MSIHNIGFYEEMTKIIFQLSKTIMKYLLSLFFCLHTIFCVMSFWKHEVTVGSRTLVGSAVDRVVLGMEKYLIEQRRVSDDEKGI